MSWVLATGYNDPDSIWVEEPRAYDGSTSTWAYTSPDPIPPSSWSSPLELTIGSMNCSKVRYWVTFPVAATLTSVIIDVYWSGAWHEVHHGSCVVNNWNEIYLGGIYSVSKMKLRLYNGGVANATGRIIEGQFWAPVIPTVTAQAVSDKEKTTATGNGNITDTGGVTCTKRGVCWNTTGNPTIADNKSEQTGSFGTGAFSRPMIGLAEGQKYYVRAYAYNPVGYGYSSQVDFITKPDITTQNPSDIERVDPSKVTANGLIKTATENIIKRGFKYGLTETDTWDKYEEGSFGEGSFSLQITSLDPDTVYYICAYIVGETWGTIYGTYVQFKTAIPYWSKKTEIKAEATDSAEDIAKVGGKKTLTINNHLIQTMSIAQNIANAYLAEYKDQKIMMVVDRPIPLPYEIGDTIWQSDFIMPYRPAAEAKVVYKPAAEATIPYKSISSGGRYLMIRKINLRFSAGNFIGTIELEG